MQASLNHSLFLWLNAPADAHAALLAVAQALAVHAHWIVVAGLLVALAQWRQADWRRGALDALLAALLARGINRAIQALWFQPRPAALGLGHQHLAHSANASFPSDHATALWAVGASLLLHRRTRPAGLAVCGLGAAVAWARVFLGVHFPLDILGAAAVALVAAPVVAALPHRRSRPATPVVVPPVTPAPVTLAD